MIKKVPAYVCAFIGLFFAIYPGETAEWQWRPIALEGISVNSVAAPQDSAKILYASITSDISEEQFGVHKSEDGGITWRFLPGSENWAASVLVVDPKSQSTVYCGSLHPMFNDPGAYPKRSRDAGSHWEVFDTYAHRVVASPYIDSLIIASGRPMGGWDLRRSTDDGATWEFLSGVESGMPSDNIIFNPADSLEVFSWCFFISGQNGLARSRDGGASWSIVLEGLIEGFDQDPLDSDHWIAMKRDLYTYTGYFCESWDGGDTWEIQELPDNIHIVSQIAFKRNDAQVIYLVDAVSGYTSLGMYRSTDGGQSWLPMNEGFSYIGITQQIFQTDERPCRLLAVRGDGLWEWTGQQSAEDVRAISSQFIYLKSISRCPFSSGITWRIVIPMFTIVDARIYSVNGVLVRNLFTKSLHGGSHVFNWDGNDEHGVEVPSGPYFLKVIADDTQSLDRVIKIR